MDNKTKIEKYFKTTSEEMNYFYAAFINTIRKIQGEHNENDVEIVKIRALTRHCLGCRHCRADIENPYVVCMLSGKLLGPNEIGCNKQERICSGNIGDYLF